MTEHRISHGFNIDPVKCSCGKVFRGKGALRKGLDHKALAEKVKSIN